MADIKLISKDTDLSKLDIYQVDWDVVVKGRKYNVVNIDGYCHTIGGKWGENSYWAYPADEEMSTSNLIEFNARQPVSFAINVHRENYIKYKWDESSIEDHVVCTIYRNGEVLYTFSCGDEEYAWHRANLLLINLQENLPTNIFKKDWEQELIGRKVYFNDEPAIITKYNKLRVFIEPDGFQYFKCPVWHREDAYDEECWKHDYGDGLWMDMDSDKIWWFREDE